MRILVWHGYLLGGTGSNVYARAVAREWSRAGHDVTVVCQERHPEELDLGSAQVVVPELPDRILPVFVLDRYEGLEPRLLQDLTREERERFVEANAAALRALLPADLVFANHVLLGGPVAAAVDARSAVYAHGSELEYSMRGRPELERWGAESLAQRRPRLRRLGAHPRRARGRRRSRRAGAGGAARCRRRPVPAGAARRGARGAARRGAPRPAEPRQPRGAAAGRGQRRAVRRVLRRASGRRSSTSGS